MAFRREKKRLGDMLINENVITKEQLEKALPIACLLYTSFPKADESDCDCFNTGHSSTSISAGLGLATARQVTGDDSVSYTHLDVYKRQH